MPEQSVAMRTILAGSCLALAGSCLDFGGVTMSCCIVLLLHDGVGGAMPAALADNRIFFDGGVPAIARRIGELGKASDEFPKRDVKCDPKATHNMIPNMCHKSAIESDPIVTQQ